MNTCFLAADPSAAGQLVAAAAPVPVAEVGAATGLGSGIAAVVSLPPPAATVSRFELSLLELPQAAKVAGSTSSAQATMEALRGSNVMGADGSTPGSADDEVHQAPRHHHQLVDRTAVKEQGDMRLSPSGCFKGDLIGTGGHGDTGPDLAIDL